MSEAIGVLRGASRGRKAWSLRHSLLGAALILVAVASPFKLGVVSGSSMSPSMQNGRLYFIDRTYFRNTPLKRSEVVVFDQDGESYIKRVVGVPGDTIYLIRYRDSGSDELVMDWQLSRLRRAMQRPPWNQTMKMVELRLGPEQYYVVGDNLPESTDSRSFGPISASAIQGRVLCAPPEAAGLDRMARQFGRPEKS